MANLSLAVKYRPKTFDDLCEQEYVKAVLRNQIKTKSFVHAYLFTGPAGCGKTTSARIFAMNLNGGKGQLFKEKGLFLGPRAPYGYEKCKTNKNQLSL